MGKIWWLASYPKSGNTWVRMFWAAYQQGRLDINDFWGSSVTDVARYYHQVVSPVPCALLEPHEVALIRCAALTHMVRQFKLDPLIMKTHSANIIIERVPFIPPALTAGGIYIVRDPRDVVVSVSRHNNRTIDSAIDYLLDSTNVLGKDSHGTFHYTSDWGTHVESWLKDKELKVARVRYEDLVDNPREKFSKIFDYMGVKVNKRKFDRALSLTDFDRLRKQEQKAGFVESVHGNFFNEGGYGHWEKHLDNNQVLRIERKLAKRMIEMGYKLSEPKVEYLQSG